MKYIEITHIRTHIYTHIRIYARGSYTVYTVYTVYITKNTRKGKHEMTTRDIAALAAILMWLTFLYRITR